MTSLIVLNKQSGNKTWQKITGSHDQLKRVAEIVHQPIKPAAGNNPEHIDRPVKFPKGDPK